MPDYNPHDVVTLAELEQLLGAAEVQRLCERITMKRWRAQAEALLKRMREIAEELPTLVPTSPETRPRWFALQEEFTRISASLDALDVPEPSGPVMPQDTSCRWCGKSYEAHLDERPPEAPQPRMPCLGLKLYFLARSSEQDECVACGLTAGGVCPDHAALGDNC